ncbi:hypothetical protein KDL01_28945 [Actinospica durhamensis]|uniref:DUF1453 domain-containing protein n=1 Tax=Actinospica durhamensis TaxID=1508375 RepID=A0A941IVJ9_9ACTN|nr:hypothetical protein [Actinospica durhamensis]MBR7837341.1 hypothetical protein [Actinospica durhamensis]
MTTLMQAMLVNVLVLVSVLATDLGPARKIGKARILRPLIVAAVIVPLFIKSPATSGTGLTLEIAGVLLGVVCGLAAAALMRVRRSPQTGKPVSRAGWGYAALWTVVIGARAAFSYGCVHWFPVQLVHFGEAHQLSVAALTDALVFMAISMLVARTLGLAARAARLTPAQV